MHVFEYVLLPSNFSYIVAVWKCLMFHDVVGLKWCISDFIAAFKID